MVSGSHRVCLKEALGILLLIALMLFVGFFIYKDCLGHHLRLPQGCDEFGYLNMAKAIDEGELFGDHAKRPFFPELISHLQNKFADEDSYRWMIAPHAYHLDPEKGKIINQYPPGVGLMLSMLPIHLRQVWFPLVCFFLWWLSWMFCWWLSGNRDWILCGVMFLMFSFLFYFFDPVYLEFKRINSVVPTYGLLLASGWLIPRKPRLAIALLGSATVFRLTNIIFVAPLWIAFLSMGDRSSRVPRMLIWKSVQTGLSVLAGGFGAYLIYVWILLGNPLLPTYSSIDQQFAGFYRVLSNFHFYFVENSGWAYVNLLSMGLLIYVAVSRKLKAWLVFGLALILCNYGFCLIHHVRISYYPYASAFIVAGLAMSHRLEKPISQKRRWFLIGTFPIITVIILIRLMFSHQPNLPPYSAQVAVYQETFGEFDVIWAEIHSGTVEYATNQAGFRYKWGPENVRLEIIRFLSAEGYSQVIWTSDKGMPEQKEVLDLLKQSNITFQEWESSNFGLGVVIPVN